MTVLCFYEEWTDPFLQQLQIRATFPSYDVPWRSMTLLKVERTSSAGFRRYLKSCFPEPAQPMMALGNAAQFIMHDINQTTGIGCRWSSIYLVFGAVVLQEPHTVLKEPHTDINPVMSCQATRENSISNDS